MFLDKRVHGVFLIMATLDRCTHARSSCGSKRNREGMNLNCCAKEAGEKSKLIMSIGEGLCELRLKGVVGECGCARRLSREVHPSLYGPYAWRPLKLCVSCHSRDHSGDDVLHFLLMRQKGNGRSPPDTSGVSTTNSSGLRSGMAPSYRAIPRHCTMGQRKISNLATVTMPQKGEGRCRKEQGRADVNS